MNVVLQVCVGTDMQSGGTPCSRLSTSAIGPWLPLLSLHTHKARYQLLAATIGRDVTTTYESPHSGSQQAAQSHTTAEAAHTNTRAWLCCWKLGWLLATRLAILG